MNEQDKLEFSKYVNGPHWYAINAISTRENAVAENIRRTVASLPSDHPCYGKIVEVLVVEQDFPVIDKKTRLQAKTKDGKLKFKRKNLFPGYIFVNMEMTDDAWYLVRNTEGVTGVTGSSGGGQKPVPIPKVEMEPILKRVGKIEDDMFKNYKVGDKVEVIAGPLSGTVGTITSAPSKENPIVKIETIFFGRKTETEVEFSNIKIYTPTKESDF